MTNATAGRPRTITAAKLDMVKRMVVARKLSLKKVCAIQHVKYGSVIAAVNTLGHSLRKMVKVYRVRVA